MRKLKKPNQDINNLQGNEASNTFTSESNAALYNEVALYGDEVMLG